MKYNRTRLINNFALYYQEYAKLYHGAPFGSNSTDYFVYTTSPSTGNTTLRAQASTLSELEKISEDLYARYSIERR